jgi:hypothetical protein
MDWAAYTNAYPDLAEAAAREGRDPTEFGAAHFAAYGQNEGRVIPQEQSFAVNPVAGMTPEDRVPAPVPPEIAPNWAVQPALPPSVVPLLDKMDWASYTQAYPDLVADAARQGIDPTTYGRMHYDSYGQQEGRQLPNFVAQPQSPASPDTSFAVNPTPAAYPDYGVENVFGARTAQLMPANEQFSTPYYEARTNTGDLAAAVGVDPTQRVRLIDPKTGEVFFEGTGPDAARMAVTQANVRSQDLGKNAGWSIEVAKPGEDWQEAGYESVDKKKSGLLGLIADIGLPILANLILPGSGFLATAGAAAAGSGVSSALQGRSLEDALLRAGVTGLTAGTLRGVGGGGGGGGSYADAIARGYANTSANPLAGAFDIASNAAGAAGDGIGSTVGEVVVRGLPAAVTQGGSSVLTNAATTGLGALAGTGIGTLVEGLDVTVPRTQGPTLDNSGLPFLFPDPTPSLVNTTPTIPGNGTGSGMGAGVGLGSSGTATGDSVSGGEGTDTLTSYTGGDTIPGGGGGGGPDITDIATILGTGLGLVGGGGGGGGGSPLNTGTAGTRASLGSIYSAGLPNQFTVQPFRAKDMSGQPPEFWRSYGSRPEAGFGYTTAEQGPNIAWQLPGASPDANWTSTDSAPWGAGVEMDKQWGALTNNDVNKLLVQATGYTGKFGAGGWQDWISKQPEPVKAKARAILRQAQKEDRIAFRKGGFAVEGMGTGRSDEIPAMLSDGEYIMDAETVALLGDGSSKAGAAKLDKFRANVRQHKGKSLAKGKFSVNAKAPERYLSGGPV